MLRTVNFRYYIVTLSVLTSVSVFLCVLVEKRLLTSIVASAYNKTFSLNCNATTYDKFSQLLHLSEIPFEKNFVVPPEVDNPKSPFYGMHYKNAYGLPLADLTNETFEEEHGGWWGEYFPQLIQSIQMQEKENPSQNSTFFTHFGIIALHKTNYTFGEEFVATITSVDGKGRPKTFGGDFYHARLVRKQDETKLYPDGIPCRVIDNNNGTYTVKAPLLLQGHLVLDVILAYSLQVIKNIIQMTLYLTCSSITRYEASFEGVSDEVSLYCSFSSKCLRKSRLCDYSTPWNRATWICENQYNETCSRLTYINIIYDKYAEFQIWRKICNSFICNYELSKQEIYVSETHAGKNQHLLQYQNLPSCGALFSNNAGTSIASVSGYFDNQLWKSLVCQQKEMKIDKLHESNLLFNHYEKCLQSKVIYMLGDSTIRQLFLKLAKELFLTVVNSMAALVWQQPRVAYDPKDINNITLYYRSHGPPMKNPGPPFSRPFIADSIKYIKIGGEKVFVVFTVGIHLHDIDPSIFLQRLKYIRNSILHHHKKFPDTKFVIKGMSNIGSVFYWNWHLYRFEIILRKFFKDMDNVLFVKFWDLTSVWRLYKDIHPPENINEQEALLLLSFMC